jgi:hypothetical protein
MFTIGRNIMADQVVTSMYYTAVYTGWVYTSPRRCPCALCYKADESADESKK